LPRDRPPSQRGPRPDGQSPGLGVGCFRPPSVPDGISRLRLTARADLTEKQIARAVATIVETVPAG
ncbi:hypothetical protein AB0M96_35730, partial [Streptomyces sp. NPDC051098]